MKMKLLAALALPVLASSLSAQPAPDAAEMLRRLKISGYIQPQYVQSENAADQFSVRRGRIKFTYQVTPSSRFVLQPDINTSGVTLKDGYAELIEPWTSWSHTLTAGQFTWPFGFELQYSSSQREMPERTLVVRTLFPGERDRGVMLSGAGFSDRFDYRVAVVNGTGTRSADVDDDKDIVGRAGLSLGAVRGGISLYRGSELGLEKRREGIDIQWTTPVPGLRLRGEYIHGVQPVPGEIDVAGWYVYAIQNLGKRHQLVARLDAFDPDTSAANDATRTTGGGYNFRWDANSKILMAYEEPGLWTLRYQFSF
ncbi:MAG TPA: hypothetical protein VFT12_06475 [Thermoanaerobaculia bacterium]|nr:hypothetical protein [Thermoanaerobaculia bacterium]